MNCSISCRKLRSRTWSSATWDSQNLCSTPRFWWGPGQCRSQSFKNCNPINSHDRAGAFCQWCGLLGLIWSVIQVNCSHSHRVLFRESPTPEFMFNIERNIWRSSDLERKSKKKKFLPKIKIGKAAHENDTNQIRRKLNNKSELRLLTARRRSSNSKLNIRSWAPSGILLSKSRVRHSSFHSAHTFHCFSPLPRVPARTREKARARGSRAREREEIYFYEKEQNSMRSPLFCQNFLYNSYFLLIKKQRHK